MRKYTRDMCTGVHVLRVEGHHSSTHGRKPLGLQSLRRGVFLLRAVIQGGKLVNSDTLNSTDEGAEESKLLSVSLKLVVIDAAGIDEPYLQAATMEAVLEAQQNNAIHVTARYRLVFDQQADAYRVEEG